MKIERIYRHWRDWEEINFNMWGEAKNKTHMLDQAIAFTGEHALYGRFMIRVSMEWEASCENALTDYSINRKAWIGHAACALALRCPEDITRKAWKHLSQEQQSLANNEAQKAITNWEGRHLTKLGSSSINYNLFTEPP